MSAASLDSQTSSEDFPSPFLQQASRQAVFVNLKPLVYPQRPSRRRKGQEESIRQVPHAAGLTEEHTSPKWENLASPMREIVFLRKAR